MKNYVVAVRWGGNAIAWWYTRFMTARLLKKMVEVARLVRETVYRNPLDNVRAVFGDFRGMVPPYHPYSEYNMLKVVDKASLKRLLHFAADGLLPWYERKTPVPLAISEPTVDVDKPLGKFARVENWIQSEDPEAFLTEEGTEFTGEAWIYLNGIITDRNVALMNGKYIATLFGRKVEVIHNPTDAIIGDLIETVAGRLWGALSKADQFAYERIVLALSRPDIHKVVFIAHSQGTVIAANIVRLLRERHLDLLHKLELYTVANCSSEMEISKDEAGRLVPYIEHFANTNDLICKLGVTAEDAKRRGDVKLDGPIFIRDAWGHLLNTHYLSGIENQEYRDPTGRSSPRLYEYLGGRVPSRLA